MNPTSPNNALQPTRLGVGRCRTSSEMKKHLKVILITAGTTTAFWALVVASLIWFSGRGPHPGNSYFTYLSIPSHAEAPSALVVEEFSKPWAGAHTEVFRSTIPSGEIRHFAFRIASNPSDSGSQP
jgi:hypothetical protein